MEYVWMVAVGLVMGWFLQGNNFGLRGVATCGVMNALVFGIGLGSVDLAPDGGRRSPVVTAAIGAVLALLLRRVLRSV